ncbi:MAG: His/Gly/Thr/Pro-type tRNA ligase C-terminal domain-containing protein, partial [Candidatus Ratteibacteria bacterium]
NYDENGIIWPLSVAPFVIDIIPTNISDNEILTVSEKIYNELNKNKIDVIFDDRDETAGIKFKDADLCGFPFQIIVGKKVKDGKVDLKIRKGNKTEEINFVNIFDYLKEKLKVKI